MTAYTLAPQLHPGQTGTHHINGAFARGAVIPGPFAVAALPDPTKLAGVLVLVSNGDAGKPCLALSDGTHWNRIALGAPVATA